MEEVIPKTFVLFLNLPKYYSSLKVQTGKNNNWQRLTNSIMFSWNITILRNLGSLSSTYAYYKIVIAPFVPTRKVKTIVSLSLLSLYPKFPSLLGLFGANYYTVPVAPFVFPINLWTLISTISFVSQFLRPGSGVFWSDLMGVTWMTPFPFCLQFVYG